MSKSRASESLTTPLPESTEKGLGTCAHEIIQTALINLKHTANTRYLEIQTIDRYIASDIDVLIQWGKKAIE